MFTTITKSAEIRAWGDFHVATIDGASLTVGGKITLLSMLSATLGSVAGDASSQLSINNTPVTTSGSTNIGGLSFGPSTSGALTLGGPIFVHGTGNWEGSITGAHNITFMSGSAGTWTGGDISGAGYVNVAKGATLSITQHNGALTKNIKNWGTLNFIAGSGTGIRFSGSIESGMDATVHCARGVNIGNSLTDFSTATSLAANGIFQNWGSFTMEDTCTVFVTTILHGTSNLMFNIIDDTRYDTLSFGAYVQFNGGVTANDVREFNYKNGANTDTWNWERDFGTKFNVIRLRAGYNSVLHREFRPRKVAYNRNTALVSPSYVVSFPYSRNADQHPYMVYGIANNRSYIFLSNPASLLSFSPIVMIVALVFAFLF